MSLRLRISRSHKLWLKAELRQARGRFVRAFLAYDKERLAAGLRAVGVRPGDSVMLHSAFQSTNGFRGSVEQLTDVFVDAVGPTGHLLMVSLPYRSSSLEYLNKFRVFDVRKTPSMMGLVSEMFRRRPDVTRSLHPTHPVLVRGPRAEWFVEDHPESRYPCGPGSPFDKLVTMDGKAVFFDVPVATYTFFHYLEHMVSAQLPFRLYTADAFEVPVIGRDGQRRIITTHVFAPEAIRRRRFDILEAALRQRGLIQQRRIGVSRIQAVRVNDTIDCVAEMARRGEFFYDMSDLPQRPGTGRTASEVHP